MAHGSKVQEHTRRRLPLGAAQDEGTGRRREGAPQRQSFPMPTGSKHGTETTADAPSR